MEKRNIFKIKNRVISDNNPSFVIVEIGQTHNGSIEKVFKFIDLISKSGADAIKFQTHYADEESTLDEKFRVKIKNFKTRYDYWKSVEFSDYEWFKISEYCKTKKIIFLSSVFSMKGFEILKKLKVPAWKIASGEYDSDYILNKIYKTNLPVLFSTGMMVENEIEKLHKKLKNKKIKHAILHCVSNYPVEIKNVGLNNILKFRNKFNCQIGYSDHSGTIIVPLLAMAFRSNIIEVHVKLDDRDKGPDSTSSISLNQLYDLCEFRNKIFILNNNPVNKRILSSDIMKMRKLFGKSIALKTDLDKGSVITKENLTFKKPGNGLKKNKINSLIGKKVRRFVSSKRTLKPNDIL